MFLFDVDIWGSIWQVARVNVAVLFFYAWLWFIDLYLNNYSAAAIEEKRRLAKEGIYSPGPVLFEKKVKPEPKPKPVYVQPEPEVVYEQPKPQPAAQPKTEPIVEQPKVVAVPVVEELKPAPVIVTEPVRVVIPNPQPAVEEPKPVLNNREQLMAWIEEEENKESE